MLCASQGSQVNTLCRYDGARLFTNLLSKDPDTKLALTNDQRPLFIRGTQREYCSKPLKHSIVKQILVFKR